MQEHIHEQICVATMMAAEQSDTIKVCPTPPLRALRLMYTDSAGVRRCRVRPWQSSDAAADAAPLPCIGLTHGTMGQGVHADCVLHASGLSATGEAVLTPDPLSLVRQLPWWPAHGMACCDLIERNGERLKPARDHHGAMQLLGLAL